MHKKYYRKGHNNIVPIAIIERSVKNDLYRGYKNFNKER
jgi:hypothetical protein